MIIRVKHETHYTVIRNKTLRDSRLSFKARGILAYLLSLPDDTTVGREELAGQGPDGKDAVMTGLRELVKAGYIQHERVQNEFGQWRMETTVRECPKAPAAGKSGSRETHGETENPAAGKTGHPVRSTKEGAAPSAPVALPFRDVSLLEPLTPEERDHGKRRAEQLRQRLAQAPA